MRAAFGRPAKVYPTFGGGPNAPATLARAVAIRHDAYVNHLSFKADNGLKRMFDTSFANPAPAGLHEMWDRTVETHATSRAIDFMGRRWTYGDLGREVARLAAGLQRLGVNKGDRVGLCLPNTPYSVVAYYAVLKIGGIVVNYNPLYVERELAHQIADSGTTVMFVIDLAAIYEKVVAVAEAAGLRKVVLCRFADVLPSGKAMLFRLMKRRHIVRRPPAAHWHVDYEDVTSEANAPRPVSVTSEDIAVLQYTGGTTGVPKAAVLTHGNLLANMRQVLREDRREQPGQNRVMGVLPFFHVFAMTAIMNYSVAVAAEMVLLPRYDLEMTLKTLVRTRPSVFHAVPTIFGAIATRAKERRCDLSFVELCVSGGAPLSVEIAEQFRALTGASLLEGYGLTEASPLVAVNPVLGPVKIGSVGRAVSETVIELRDPITRALVPEGEKGEIVVRGPQVMRGYWNRPEETAAVIDEYGLRTGDIGYRDADGYIYLVDRIKDVILSGGYNVYPRVIEEALYQHDAVAEAVVIGVPDAYRGQSAKAFVVLRPGVHVSPDQLSTFLEGYVSKIERPKSIEIRDTLPKTAVGKLSRKELVAEEAAKAGDDDMRPRDKKNEKKNDKTHGASA